uniref:Uncharacterized protein n=1 Tax=Oncorhynchus kisutch TaxID=8019 RepID=A0A8C7MVG9_ONCKI
MLVKIWYHSLKELSDNYERMVNPEKALEDSKTPLFKEEPMSDVDFPVSEEPKVDLGSGEQTLPMGMLGAPQRESVWQWRVKSSPLWHLSQMVPQDSEEGQVSGQRVLGASCSRRGSPMSTMSEADSMVSSPKGVVSDGSNSSPDSLMGTSAVFNQRPRKSMKKM